MVRGRKSYMLNPPKKEQVKGGMITVRMDARLHKRFAYLCRTVLNQSINQVLVDSIVEQVQRICPTCDGLGTIEAYRGEPSQGKERVTCDHCFGKKLFDKGVPNEAGEKQD